MGLGDTVERFIKARRLRKLAALHSPLGDYYRAGGDALLLRGAPIGSEDTVLDVGAFGARCVAVEPVPSFCRTLRERFSSNGRVRIVEAAIGTSDSEIELRVQNDSTSAYASPGGERIRVPSIDAARLVKEAAPVALVKLNVEGAEYDALDRLVSAELLAGIRSVLVQFHRAAPDSEERRERIRQALAATHREVFSYPFVWERWDLSR
jgi:FkbM family methyltransferase